MPRIRHPLQIESLGEENEQRVLRRLHSQQLLVPFRILRRLARNASSCSDSVTSIMRICRTREPEQRRLINWDWRLRIGSYLLVVLNAAVNLVETYNALLEA